MLTLQEIKRYTPPTLHVGREVYIDFYAFDPISGKMKRKKIKLNSIPSNQRRKYAKDLINRLSEQLALGWNPWIEKENGTSYILFRDACYNYKRYIDKMLADGTYRPESHKSYASYLKI